MMLYFILCDITLAVNDKTN